MNILQNIFADHFHKLLNSNIKIRDTVIENVDKMIHCGDYKRGYAFYICEHCSRFIVSPFRCRSRFCTSCGYKYKLDRVDSIVNTAYNCNHRQIVFTIAQELWKYFFFFFLFNFLFEVVNKTIYSILNESFKKKKKIKKIKKYFF